MRRLRVLFVTVWFPTPENPTAQTFVRSHALAAARRHDVAVLHLRDTPGARTAPRRMPSHEVHAGLPVWEARIHRSRIPGASVAGRIAAARQAWPAIEAALGHIDVVHAHMVEAAAPALAAGLGWRQGRTARVISEHYSGFAVGSLTPGQRRKSRMLFHRFDRVLPVSTELARSLGSFGIDDRMEVVPNAFDPSVFHPAHDDEPRPEHGGPARLIAVGRLVPVKGFDVLIRALAMLDDPPRWQLEIIGDGPAKDVLRTLSEDHGLAGRIRFTGRLEPSAVAIAMRRSHLFVAPSRYETQNVALVEAIGSGLAVVASDVGGMPEVLELAGDGRLVAPEDPRALAAALREELPRVTARTAADRRDLASRAQDLWSLEAVGSQLDTIYRSVLQT